jgi:hypothetical protein
MVELTGCLSRNVQIQPNGLIGTWKTKTLQTEWGPAIIEVTFRNSSELEFKLTSVPGQHSVVSKGKYRLNENQLTSEAINKGEPVLISLKKDHLILQTQSEPPQQFTRE